MPAPLMIGTVRIGVFTPDVASGRGDSTIDAGPIATRLARAAS